MLTGMPVASSRSSTVLASRDTSRALSMMTLGVEICRVSLCGRAMSTSLRRSSSTDGTSCARAADIGHVMTTPRQTASRTTGARETRSVVSARSADDRTGWTATCPAPGWRRTRSARPISGATQDHGGVGDRFISGPTSSAGLLQPASCICLAGLRTPPPAPRRPRRREAERFPHPRTLWRAGESCWKSRG